MTGDLCGVDPDVHGCVTIIGDRGTVGGGSYIKTYWRRINLSLGSSVYKNNASVKPSSLALIYVIKY